MHAHSLKELGEGVAGVIGALLDLVYPTLCLGCDLRLPAPAGDRIPLCRSCQAALPSATPSILVDRLKRLPQAAGVFDRVFALWVFDAEGTIQRLQHTLKYHNQPKLGVSLGRLLGRELDRYFGPPSFDMVVSVPLSWPRRLERGYNQSGRLALGVAEVLGQAQSSVEDTLIRTRATRSQTSLSRAFRWENVDGAFRIADDAHLHGKRVLLVDDILTTGATLTAAAQPLKDAGATVDLAVLATVAD